MKLSGGDLKEIENMKVKCEINRNRRDIIEWSVMRGFFNDSGDMSVGIPGSIIQFEIRSDTANEEDMKFIKWLIYQAVKEFRVGRITDEFDEEQMSKYWERMGLICYEDYL